MELKKECFIIVKNDDLIEKTTGIIYQGNATFSNNILTFQIQNESYEFTKIGNHYLTLCHDGEMNYQLDLKPNTSFDTQLTVAGYAVDIECKCKQLMFHHNQWIIEYQIIQMDSLLFHSRITIDFK